MFQSYKAVALASFLLLLSACAGGPTQRSGAAQDGDWFTSPVLRVVSDGHTGSIRGGGISASGKFLLTSSQDKTARVWSVADGKTLHVLRPPIGPGFNGFLTAATISPDGTLGAVGGWTPGGPASHFLIYIFDIVSGQIRTTLDTDAGVPVLKIVWSSDGAYLAAGLSTGPTGIAQGIRVWRAADWALVTKDTDYEGECFEVTFDQSDRLVTMTGLGYIHLYNKFFERIAKANLGDGAEHEYHVAISPDGKKIAATWLHKDIEILSGDDLKKMYVAGYKKLGDWKGGHDLQYYTFSALTWSFDGRQLYAGLTLSDTPSLFAAKHSLGVVRIWQDQGRGAVRDIELTNKSDPRLQSLLPVPGGGIVFLQGADWGKIDGSGRVNLYASDANNFLTREGGASKLGITADGAGISFASDVDDNRRTFFLRDRNVEVSQRALPGFYSASTAVAGHTVSGIFTDKPLLDGRPLEVLKDGTDTNAAAMTSQIILLGTQSHLYGYGPNGQIEWRIPVAADILQINLTPDSRIAVASFIDGSIRWYRAKDGQELLAFFAHKDGKRWVLWTPSGYYDASPGGEDLIGWHVNHGYDRAADIFPASSFHDQFYRPDIVSLVLNLADEHRAIAEANSRRPSTGTSQFSAVPDITKVLPPVVTILSPGDFQAPAGSPVTLSYSVRSPSGESLVSVEARFDGRPEDSQARGPAPTGLSRPGAESYDSIRVTPPPGTHVISLLAQTATSTSVPAILKLATSGSQPIAKPKLYVLAVGISAYSRPELKLGYPAKDANDFSHVMQTHSALYRAVESRVLSDGNATRADVLAGLTWLKGAPAQGDVAMLFLAGHGTSDNSGAYYYLPQDADPANLRATAISNRDLVDTIAAIQGRVVMFIDTCHAGAALSGRSDDLVNQLSTAKSGAVVFASSTGEQNSLERSDWANGAFTKELVDGLAGRADLFGKGAVSVANLNSWLANKVPELTGSKQTPAFAIPYTISDFVIAQ